MNASALDRLTSGQLGHGGGVGFCGSGESKCPYEMEGHEAWFFSMSWIMPYVLSALGNSGLRETPPFMVIGEP